MPNHKPDSLVSDQQSLQKVDWRARLLDRDGLDLPAILSVLQNNQGVTRDLLADKSRADWDTLAGIHDDTSDHIAEIEHVMEREAERKAPRRVFAYQDMKGAAE